MIKPFTGNYPLTQGFGEHSQDYARFGLLGHNGLDYGLPMGTEIISSISGQVIEVADDPTGYGLYIKIENDAEGFLVAHLKEQHISVGQNIDQRQHIGLSDNTGNSTGSHLHFGYFRKPRDRTNGYAGYIDPTPYFDESDIITDDMPQYLKTLFQENGLSENNESQVREFFEKARKFDNLATDLDNARKEIELLKQDLIALQKSSDGPKTADLSLLSTKDLLFALIKKYFK